MNDQSIPLAPQLVRDMVDELSAGLAANPTQETAAAKVGMLLAAIAHKCALCVATPGGFIGLNEAADCPETGCPLNSFGPPVFKCVRARLARQGYAAGGLQ